MAKLKPGDRVDCRVKQATIVSPYRDYDEVKTFEIVAKDAFGYYLYVPHYWLINGTSKADKYQCKSLNIDKKFLDEKIIYIQESMIYKIHAVLDEMHCSNCGEFFQMATPNQSNGTLLCWSCRENPYR
jgi:NAD-dependent SIR2 family protein deacetylase